MARIQIDRDILLSQLNKSFVLLISLEMHILLHSDLKIEYERTYTSKILRFFIICSLGSFFSSLI